MRRLPGRAFDLGKIRKARYLPIIFLLPVLYVLTAEVMRLAGMGLPDAHEVQVRQDIRRKRLRRWEAVDLHMSDSSACLSVDPGACRFLTKITARYQDGAIRYHIETDCPHASKLEGVLDPELGPFEALNMPFAENPIYIACGKVLLHSACPLPSALIKTAEAVAGLGLKRPVRFDFDC